MVEIKNDNKSIQINNNQEDIKLEGYSKIIDVNNNSKDLVIPTVVKEVSVLTKTEDIGLVIDSTEINLVNTINSITVANNPIFAPFNYNTVSTITDGITTIENPQTITITGAIVENRGDNKAEIIINMEGGNATTFNNKAPTYYLDRNNHIGTQSVDTITGLATVAVTNNYSDLDNRPILGTASVLNAGTKAGEVLLLSENNKLPAIDGSLLTNIQTNFELTYLTTTSLLSRTINRLVFLDSELGSFNVQLPLDPLNGDRIIFIDSIGNNPDNPIGLGLNSVTLISSDTHNIQGYSSVTLDDENTTIALVYKDGRWNIYHASF